MRFQTPDLVNFGPPSGNTLPSKIAPEPPLPRRAPSGHTRGRRRETLLRIYAPESHGPHWRNRMSTRGDGLPSWTSWIGLEWNAKRGHFVRWNAAVLSAVSLPLRAKGRRNSNTHSEPNSISLAREGSVLLLFFTWVFRHCIKLQETVSRQSTFNTKLTVISTMETARSIVFHKPKLLLFSRGKRSVRRFQFTDASVVTRWFELTRDRNETKMNFPDEFW